MASLIPGYEYDIFISYRQKDNKGDRWVSEFVEALKTELESTFKDEISVYFDINPHDGLLETHDVNASLNEKLNCLVFIPIISRTYCDPKSFAWEHEFKAFVEQASQDQFGLRVKLSNSNVANRVLPVRIHDLDTDDMKLCESLIGGVLRGVDFIYKSPGVNRPLRPKEDNLHENLNHTIYRDQINKVALAVKDIFESLRAPVSPGQQNDKVTPVRERTWKGESVIGKTVLKERSKSKQTEIADKRRSFAASKLKTSRIQKTIDSIVVIPFVNASEDPEAEYLSDGITDSLMNRLAQLSRLRVISRGSASRFKGEDVDPERCRLELGVQAMVTGRVFRHGEQLSINANLVDVRTNTHLWGEKYSRTFSDIFAIEDDITSQITERLQSHIMPDEKKRLLKQPTLSPKAYELCLRSRYFRNLFTQKGFRKAIEYLELALIEDPACALAHGEMAMCYWGLGNLGYMPPGEAYPVVKAAATRALELDGTLAEAHMALGFFCQDYEWDWTSAEKEFTLAVQLKPGDSWSHMGYSWFLGIMRRHKESVAEMRRALELDPLSILVATCVGEVLMLAHDSDSAIDQCLSVIALDSTYWVTHLMLGLAYQQKGLIQEAVEAFEKGIALIEEDPVIIAVLGNALGIIGRTDEARMILDKLLELRKQTYLSPFWISIVHLGLAEIDQAFDWLGKGLEERAAYMYMIQLYPQFDAIRNDTRLRDIRRKMNLLSK